MRTEKNLLLTALLVSACILLGVGRASAAVTVTGANGGGNLSADRAGNAASPAWTTLAPIAIAEGANGDFAAGTNVTLVLKTPAGFEFNTVVTPDVAATAGTNIASAGAAMKDPTTITVTLTVSGATSADTLAVGRTTGIQVRPSAGSPLATGKHIYRPSTGGGTATITGITTSADGSSGSDFGDLTEVVGASAAIRVETAANGSGTIVPAQNVTAGSAITAYAIARDAFTNFVANVAADVGGWSLVNSTGGVASGDLVPAGDRKSAVFTGHLVGSANLLATFGALTPTDSRLITVVPAAASKLVVATQPSPTAVVGVPFAQQPVVWLEDQYGNLRSSDTLLVTASRNGGTGTLQGTTSVAAVGGVATFTNLAHPVVSDITITFFSGSLTPATSQTISVGAGPFSQLQVLLPGETATPGVAPGKSGTPTAQTTGAAFNVRVIAVDASWYPSSTVTDTMAITSSDGTAILPANAALINGTNSFAVTFKNAGSQTVTATDITAGRPSGTSSTVTVNAASFAKLQLLLPGETAAPGTTIGKTGTPNAQTAGASYSVTVNSVDAYWNRISTNDTVAITSTDANDVLPANAALVAGTRTFSLTNKTAGSWTVTASDTTHAGVTANTSPAITVNAGAFTRLQVLMPGEAAAGGTTTGKTGAPSAQTAGTAFNVTVNAVDACWNRVNTVTDTVDISSTDANATLPTETPLVAGTETLSVTFRTVGTATVTATDATDGSKTASTSPSTTVNVGAFAKLQLLLPGETAAPGTTSGKTGTPSAKTAGTAFTVTVNGVDADWNLVTSASGNSYTMRITSSDANATLPSNANLANGTKTFSVTLKTAGSATVTATDVDDGTKTPSTSPSTTVNAGAFTKLQLLVPGESAAPGTTTGKTGTPTVQNIETPFDVTVNAVDANWNLVNSVSDIVGITSSDANATLPGNAALSGGTHAFSVKLNTAGSRTVTATDTSDGSKTSNTSPSVTVAGAFAKLQVLLPGETAAPGTTSGKTGTPTAQTAGASFSVTVRAVDGNWNLISTNDTIHLTSSDPQATLPANAALSAGSRAFTVTNKTSGIQTVAASDVTHTGIGSDTGTAAIINPAAASKLMIATQPSSTATAGEAFEQQPVIYIEDAYNNVRSNDTLTVTATRNAGVGTLRGTTNVAAIAGAVTFTTLSHPYATNITINFTSGALTAATSSVVAVSPSTYSKLLVVAPGQTNAPGTASGVGGTATSQAAGAAFAVKIIASDAYGNLINTVTDLVGIASSDTTAILPAAAALINGTNSFSVALRSAGAQTVTASDVTDGQTTGTSSAVTVNRGPFAKLQLLVPGETAVPGSTTGKLGTPSAQIGETSFNVTVNAVDANWNLISTNDTVKITSSDANAALPANAALVGGTKSFSVALKTGGASTITASNVTHSAIAASTSPPISVSNVVPVSGTRPLVAIHDSELTRALETLTATNPTPTGTGTTGFEWWPTNWHYFVMPESVEEALRSDGTAYEVVGDADISTGRLLAANGQPRCPIVISLASEAVRDDEIAQLTNYVAAGGTLLVGSSAFTRNTDGTTRGDFALANQMGLHMVNPSLLNWESSATFSKTLDHSLVSHIPAGVLTWQMPSAADEVPWGISPDHTFAGAHAVWQVQVSDAVVIAQGSAFPYLAIKPYGKGQFIYCAAMQPLIGHGGYAPGMYAYGIFRKAIELAFASSKLPVPKLSPWPYAYDAALTVRHDLENYQPLISTIESSAQYEFTNGVKGDYYFCTGTLRVELTNSATIITNLRSAVSNYGATIGSHNGGLKNPNNSSLVLSNYDYWHWGPDEALGIIPSGYTSGKAYALTSLSNSFRDIEGWLPGLTNGIRSWVGCYFNSTREDSYDVQEQLGVKTAGEQKLGPFPHWTVSTRTSGKRYSSVTLPVSDWFVGSQVVQAMESGHTVSSIHAAVDYYYSLGGLINVYSHSLSDGSGQVGGLVQEYIRYGVAKPRIWSANAFGVYSWWLARSNAQVIPSYSTNGNQSITTLSIKGATDPRTAVEILVPDPSYYGLQVFTNGTAASGNGYRTNGQLVKLLVGTSVTNAEIRYTVAPLTENDLYYMTQGTTLTIPAPGVLSNDVAGLSGISTAVLASGPAHGTLALSADGGFNYTPATNFSGVDSFSYQANDGVTNSGTAIVTICVTPVGKLFSEDFTRSGAGGDPLAPWQVSLGAWVITNGVLEGTSALQTYGFAYADTSWRDYYVQGRFQFPAGAFGGGLGGRLNPVTGAHYAVWIYPEGSPGGSSVLKLLKFQSWTSFGYNDSSYTPMQQVSLAGVGTNWHTVKLAFHSNQIAVYFDGSQVISMPDDEPQPYYSGGISVDMWTDSTDYPMSVDDVSASPLVIADSYGVYENTTLTVPTPGPLTNDTGVYGTNLTAVLVNGPANGTLNLNSNGGFSYAPAASFAGADSFVYQAADGQTNLGTATVTITVNPAIIVTADNQSRTYGAANPVLTGSILGLGSGDNVTASFSTVAGTNSPVGSYPITISLSDPDHKLNNRVVITNLGALTVNPAPLTVTADNQTKVYGAAKSTLTGSLVGVQNNDNITVDCSTSAGAGSGVGSYSILASLADPDHKLGNYSVTTNNATLTVTPATLTVTADPQSRTYGAPNPVLTAAISGFVNGDTQVAPVVIGGPLLTTTATTASDTGSYPITVGLGGLNAANYTFNLVNGTLSITPAPLTGTAGAKSRLYGASNPPLTVSYSGFVNGQDASVVTGTLSGSTSATTNSPVGGYPISVWGQSAPNYTLHYVEGTLTVLPAPLLVVGDNASRAYGQPNPAFTASVSGWVNGEDTNVLGGTLVLSSPAQTNSPVGSYPIIPDSLTATNYAITFSNGTLTVTAYALSVTVNDASRVYGAANPLLSGTIVGIENGDNITATYTTIATPASPAGNYPIIIGLSDPDHKLANYAVTTNNGTLTVNPALLTVTADPKTKIYGADKPTLTGSLVGVQNDDNIAADYSTTAGTGSGVGAYPILASLVDPDHKLGNYSVTTTNATLTVTPATLTVTADPQSRTYGAPNPVLTATISGFVNGDTQAVPTVIGVPLLTTTATTASDAGSYPIMVGLGSLNAANYTFNLVNGTLSITPAPLTGTAGAKSRLYGASNPPLTVSYSGFVNGQDASVVTGTLSGSTSATTNSPVGGYPISVWGQSAPNYTLHYVEGTLTVLPAPLLVVGDNASRAYGQPNPAFTASVSGWVNGEDTNVLGGTLVLSSPAQTNSPVGGYPIIPDGLTSTNYAITFSNGTLTVTAYALSVTANNQSRTYGAANPLLTGSLVGLQNGDNITAAYVTEAGITSSVGGYPITISLWNPDHKLNNYSVTTNNATLTVTPATLTVIADPQSRTYGAPNPVLTATIGGFVNGDTHVASVLTGAPVLTTTATTDSDTGGYPITVALGSLNAANYTFSLVNGTLSITPAPLTGTADAKSRLYGASNPPLTVTYSGFVNGQNASVVTGTLSGSTSATTNSPVGGYPISVWGQSAPNYTLHYVEGTLTVESAPLLVAADNASRAYGQPNPAFTATISGWVNGEGTNVLGGALVLSSSAQTNSPVGGYPIIPDGLTSTNYAITFSNGTLTVTAYALSVTANNQSRTYGEANPALTGSLVGLRNGDNITAAYASTATPASPVGGYPIIIGLSDPDHKLANYAVTTNNGTLTVNPALLTVTADPKTKIYGADKPTLTGSLVGVQNDDNIAADYSTTAGTGSGVGAYPILASLVDPDHKLGNYSVTTTNATLTVTPATLTVTADPQSRTYGAPNPVLTATLSGFVNGDTQAAPTVIGAPVLTTTATTASDAGSYPIMVGLGSLNAANYTFSLVNGSMNITPAPLTGTADAKSRSYGASNPPLTVSYSGFVNGQDASVVTGTLSGSTSATTNSPVGSYPISVWGQSAPNYTLHYVDGTLTVLPTPLLVVGDNASRAYGQPNPAFTASVSGWVNGEGTNVLGGALVLSSPAQTNSPVGGYPIIADGLTSTNYAITFSNGTLTVTAYALSVTANNQSRTYGEANPALTGSLVGLRNGDNITAAYASTATPASPVGGYPIIIGLSDPDHKLANYAVTTNNGTLTVNPALLTVTADPKTKIYGADKPTLTGSLVGVQNDDNIAADYSTTAGTGSGVGAYPILASLVDPDHKLGNYSVTTTNATLTVTPATLTVTADPQSRTYGAPNPVLTATISGFVNGDTHVASVLTGAPILTTTATTASDTGSYPIMVALGNLNAANYTFSLVNGVLSITPAPLTGTAEAKSRLYGASNPPLTVSYSGFVNGQDASVVTGTLDGSTSATANSPVGSYPISVWGQSAPNYTLHYVEGTLTVLPTPLLVVGDNASRAYGQPNPAFTASVSGWVNGEGTNVLGGALVLSSPAQTNSPVGGYPIIADGLTSTNYAITFSNGTLTVTAYALSVTASNASRVYGATNPVLSGTIVGIENGDNITASYASTATPASPAGNYPILVSLLDPDHRLANYAVTTNNGTLTVNPADLTVVANDASRVYGATNPAFMLSYGGFVGSEGVTNLTELPQASSIAQPNSRVGDYQITLTGGSAANYKLILQNGTLTVTPASLIVAANNASRVYGATNPLFSGTITGIQNGDNIAATYATTATVTSPVGTYPITPTLVDSSGRLGNYTVNSTNGALTVTAAGLTVVANNASRAYGVTNPVFTGTFTGIQNGDNITVTYATTATVTSPVGTYPITPTLVDPSGKLANYTVSSSNGALTVSPAGLTVSADPQSKWYGQADPPLTWRVTSGALVNGDSLSGALSRVAGENAGPYAILQGTLAASANYALTYVGSHLTITPSWLLAQADDKSRMYGTTNPVLTTSYSGFVGTDGVTNLTEPLQASTAAQINSPVGAYDITLTGGSASNYVIIPLNGKLTVTAAALSVAANSTSRAYGATNPVFTGSLTGLQNGDNISATYGTTATVTSPVGTYPITPTLADPSGKLSNYSLTTSNGTLTVTAAGLTVVANNASRSYGAGNPAFSGSLTGLQNGDNISATYSTTATVLSPVGTYPIAPTLADPNGKLANYSLTTSDGTLTVTAAGLTVLANNASRTYGSSNPAFSGSLTGLQNGDNISATYTTTATMASPVGTYPITPTLTDPTGKLANYSLTTSNGTLTVTAAGLSVVANNASRTYGANNPPFSGSLTGLQNGDNISATYATTATVASPAGTYPITPTLADLDGKLANYSLTTSNGTLTVTAAGLSVVANNASRTYGANNPPFSGSLTGLQNGDNISATYATTATVASPAGTYPITPTLADLDGKLANYSLTASNGTLTVTAAGLTVAANNASRAYGAPNPAFTGTITGLQNGDTITATYATTATVTSVAGTYPITPALVDPGHKLPNYAVTLNNGTLTVTSTTTPAILSIAPSGNGNAVITWTSISNSVYRVQYKARLASTNWTDLAPDVIATGSTASFTDHPAGAPQRFYRVLFVSSSPPVAPVITSIVGAGTPNVVITWNATSNRVYRVQYKASLNSAYWLNLAPDVTATGSTTSFTDHPGAASPRFYRVVLLSTVTPLTPLVVVANNASRTYGAANPIFSGTITGLQSGDNITVTYTTTATTPNPVGTYPITPMLVDTNGKLDKYLVSMTNGTLTVTPAPLAATVNNTSRVYGAANLVFNGTLTGLQNGDIITATYFSSATPSSAVGTYPITPTLSDPGSKLSNYNVSTTDGTLSVTPAALTVTANNASRPYGAANPAFSGTITGLQNGDNITATYTTIATPSSPAGIYPIVPSLLDTGHRLSNYAVALNNGTLTVTAPTSPVILSVVRSGNTDFVITWASVSNSVYRVQYKASLASSNWITLAPDITATGSTASYTDHPGATPQRFYRVVLLPDGSPPVALGIKGNSNGSLTVTFAGTPGTQYVVQATTSLVPPIAWVNVATNTADATGQWTFAESTPNLARRFYRSVRP